MSTSPRNANTNSGSIYASGPGFTPARLGSSPPSRPGQLDSQMADNLAGGPDPQAVNDMSHASAAALLDRVHRSQDPDVVKRVLTLVDVEGVDVIAGLWSDAEPESLPGVLWRLYILRTWMHSDRKAIISLWRLGEPEASAASAIAGVDQTHREEDMARTADSILSGAFTGDFAVAMERAAAFTDVIVRGLRMQASKVTHSRMNGNRQTQAAKLMHRAANLEQTSRAFLHGARLWRQGKLE